MDHQNNGVKYVYVLLSSFCMNVYVSFEYVFLGEYVLLDLPPTLSVSEMAPPSGLSRRSVISFVGSKCEPKGSRALMASFEDSESDKIISRGTCSHLCEVAVQHVGRLDDLSIKHERVRTGCFAIVFPK